MEKGACSRRTQGEKWVLRIPGSSHQVLWMKTKMTITGVGKGGSQHSYDSLVSPLFYLLLSRLVARGGGSLPGALLGNSGTGDLDVGVFSTF